MRRYLSSDMHVVFPDMPITREFNLQNKGAFISTNNDKATIVTHNKTVELSLNEIGMDRDDTGWFIDDFYDFEEDY